MKKSFLIVALALFSVGASAQAEGGKKNQYKVETNKFWNNWFLDASGGVQVYFGDADSKQSFGKRLAPAVDLSLGKWFTPGIAVRFGYMGLKAKGATTSASGNHSTGKEIKDGYYKQEWNMMNLHTEVMFNLSNMFCGYNAERVYSFIPYAGMSLLHSYDRPKTNEFAFTAGLVNKFRLSPALDLNLEVRGTLVKDGFDSEFGGKSKEGLGAVTLGLTYKFKQRNFNNVKTHTGISESELRRVQNQLRDAMDYNNQLKDEVEELRNRKPEVVVKEVPADESRVIFFPIGKSEISIRDMVTVRLIADGMKKADANTVYTIKGYADSATGSAAYNNNLSLKRAQAVCDALVKEGVKASMLKAEGMGGVKSVFGTDNRLSRVVIIK